MSAAKVLIYALQNDDSWTATEDEVSMMGVGLFGVRHVRYTVKLDGRMFIYGHPEHDDGEHRWFWPWTRRRVAQAARKRHAIIQAEGATP